MQELVREHRRFGLPRIHYLLKREGVVRNIKRTRRIYRELGLQLAKRKRRTKQGAVIRCPRPKAVHVGEIWSFDFVMDRIENGRRLKCLTVVDDFSKKSPGILADYSITGDDLTKFLDGLDFLPKRLRCDNGPEMTSRAFLEWAYRKQIEVEYIQPGKPIQNAYIESFNSRFREECLNEHAFQDLENAKKRIESWRRYYNEKRPHTAIEFKTPNEFEEEWKKAN
jgi:putative transposase